jgi:hypothetical protein
MMKSSQRLKRGLEMKCCRAKEGLTNHFETHLEDPACSLECGDPSGGGGGITQHKLYEKKKERSDCDTHNNIKSYNSKDGFERDIHACYLSLRM